MCRDLQALIMVANRNKRVSISNASKLSSRDVTSNGHNDERRVCECMDSIVITVIKYICIVIIFFALLGVIIFVSQDVKGGYLHVGPHSNCS